MSHHHPHQQHTELGGLEGVDFRKLGYHNPRVERSVIHDQDPKAELREGTEHPQSLHHVAGPDAAHELTKRLPHVEKPRPVTDPDQEPFDPVLQGFLREHPGVLNAPPAIPEDVEGSEGRRLPRAKRIAQSLADSPTMRRQLANVPDEALVLDPAEVRNDPMDEQVAAPMDDVDPYADHRQFKPYI